MTIFDKYARNDGNLDNYFFGFCLVMATVIVRATTTFPFCYNLFVAIFTQGNVMATEDDNVVKEPLDLIKFNLDERIYVKLCVDHELCGKLHVRIFLCTQGFCCYAYILLY
jgi:hypothetical protein